MRTVKNILQTGRNITPNITSFTLAMSVATIPINSYKDT
jgi:hypothetical protein